jgi:TetR/AcrR family transcriptional regulator, transcriptional repressor for nem operon
MSVTGSDTDRPEERTFTAKGLATRERIVEVAAALMYSGGVAGTSWEDVQKGAGVSASQLYHYFGDKQGLVRAVISHQTRALLESQQPHLASLDGLEALRAWRDLLVEGRRQIQCQGGCPLGSLAGELFEAHPECREELVDGFDQWEAAIRSGLQTMHKRGDLRRSADPDRLATALLAAVQGGLVLSQVHRAVDPLEAALDTTLEHIASLTTKRRSGRRRMESHR